MGIAPTAGPAKEYFMVLLWDSRAFIILYSLSAVSGRMKGPLLFGSLSGEEEAYVIKSSHDKESNYAYHFCDYDKLES